MKNNFLFSLFLNRFPTEESCLEEIKKLRFPNGMYCDSCHTETKHYRVRNRTAYVCKVCRHHIYPLVGTIFEKSPTPLRFWFYALFLMTHTRAKISITQLQKELGVTYKTAWRMYKRIYVLMEQNNGDLLADSVENNLLRWTFFNKFELTVVEKQETTE